MPAIIIDGKETAKQIRISIKKRSQKLAEGGIVPTLAVILVGDDAGSQIYVRNKESACEKCAIRSIVIRMPADTAQDDLHAEIDRINADDSIHGLLIQLPLPRHLDEMAAIRRVDYRKDVDGFHLINAGALLLGEPASAACTPSGCIELLKRYNVPLASKNAVVIGRSNIVGKPMALLLLREHCTVTICHSRTDGIRDIARSADILVAALGRPGFVTADMVKPGAAVIDVGVNRLPDGKVCGDVDYGAVSEIAGWITPVPGGVGPMTIAMLMNNTLEAAARYGR